MEREAQTELRVDKDFLNTRLMDSWFVHITSLSSEPSLLGRFYHGELSSRRLLVAWMTLWVETHTSAIFKGLGNS